MGAEGHPSAALEALRALATPDPPVGAPRHQFVRHVLGGHADELLARIVDRRDDFAENESRAFSYRHGWALPAVPDLTDPVTDVVWRMLDAWRTALDVDVGAQASQEALELSDVAVTAFLDGDFLSQHRDDGRHSKPNGRVLSFVYWLHCVPQAFTGGQLRLCGWDRRDGELIPAPPAVDIEPEHDTLVVFASSTMHEVFPVQMRSNDFADARFAVTGFVRRRLSPTV